MTRTPVARIGMVSMAAVLLAACGGDDDTAATTAGTEPVESTTAVVPITSAAPTAPAPTTPATPVPTAEADDTAAPTAAPGSVPEEVSTECVDGEWAADLDDLIGQFAEQMSSSGLTVTAAEASGTQTLAIGREGVLGFAAEMTFVITIDAGNGVTMTMTQTQAGTLGADWVWSSPTATGGTMSFSNFDNSEYHVETTMEMGGQVTSAPNETPSAAMGDVPMDVTCEGDTMTTHPQASPFTTRWTRTD